MALATVALAITAIGAGVSTVAAIQQGAYQKKVSQYNAQVLENQKISIQQKAELDVQQHRENVKRLQGAQRTAYASSGIDLSGSAMDVMMDTERRGLLDEKIIKYNAAQGISGTEAEIGLTLAEGQQAYKSGLIQAGSSLLEGAGKFVNIQNQKKRGLL